MVESGWARVDGAGWNVGPSRGWRCSVLLQAWSMKRAWRSRREKSLNSYAGLKGK